MAGSTGANRAWFGERAADRDRPGHLRRGRGRARTRGRAATVRRRLLGAVAIAGRLATHDRRGPGAGAAPPLPGARRRPLDQRRPRRTGRRRARVNLHRVTGVDAERFAPDDVEVFVAGLLAAVDVDDGPTDEQLAVLRAFVDHLWRRTDLDVAAITPL